MSNDKLTRWVGPSPVELDIWRNSISSELSNDNTTYSPLSSGEIRDILSEDRQVTVKGLILTSKQIITLLDALQFVYDMEGSISAEDIEDCRRAILQAK